jgi:hypothetical protein
MDADGLTLLFNYTTDFDRRHRANVAMCVIRR